MSEVCPLCGYESARGFDYGCPNCTESHPGKSWSTEVSWKKKYDTLLAQARRLRDMMVFNYEGPCPKWGLPLCNCRHCTLLRDTADLEVTP